MLFRKILLGIAVAVITGCSGSEKASDSQNTTEEPPTTPHSEDASQASTRNRLAGDDNHTDEGKTAPVRSAESHAHGDAELAIVLENGVVTIELDSPLYNILGFEHKPETEAQEASVSRAETQLKLGDKLFGFNAAAGCKFKPSGQVINLFETGSEPEEHNDNHKDDHDDHDKHDEDEAHEDEHDEDTHKDMILRYQFLCQKPTSLTKVDVNLFDFFEELSEIDVTFLGPQAQKHETLTRKNMQMDITQ